MQNLKGKLRWLFYRHPALYYARFYLYKRKFDKSLVDRECYNSYNEKSDIPLLFHDVNKSFSLSTTEGLELAIMLAKELRSRVSGGRGLGLSSEKALKLMINGKGGVCSDITQAYNNFCILNDIKIREWGIIDKLYGAKFGHAFNEFYSDELQKWVLIDVSKCIYFIDPNTNNKLSALELFNCLKHNDPIEYVSFLPDKDLYFNKNLDEAVERIYLKKDRLPFLITNYNIKFYDRLLNTFQSWLPTFVIHFMAVPLFKNVRFVLIRELNEPH